MENTIANPTPQPGSQQQAQPATRPPQPQDLFIPAAQQLELVRKWNAERNWGFPKGDFATFGASPDFMTSQVGALPAVVLEVSLDTVQQTFEEAWALAVAAQEGRHWRWDQVKSDTEHLRLLSGIQHQRGLRWRIVDLAANWDRKEGIRPMDVRDPGKSPHAAILWAAALFPTWIQAMDGTTVPYVWIPGYEACVAGIRSWSLVPGLGFDRGNRRVRLSAFGRVGRGRRWAVPESRE